MKKFIIFAVLICVLCTLSAQKGRNFKAANRFSNSIEFSVGVGYRGLSLIQKPPYTCDGFNFDKIINMGKFSVGYHFTPVLGARLTLKEGEVMSNPKNIPGLTVSMDPLIHTSVDLLVNLTNLWETRPKRNNKIFDMFTNKSFLRIKLCDLDLYLFGNPTIVFGAGVVTFRQKDVQVQYSNLAFNGGLLLQVVRCKGFSIYLEGNIAFSNNAVRSLSNSEVIDSRINGWIATADLSGGVSFKIPTKHKNQRRYYTGGRRY